MENQVFRDVKSILTRALGFSPSLLPRLRQKTVQPEAKRKILVACHEIDVVGSLFRFERFGRVVAQGGHQVAFLAFSDTPQRIRRTDFPIFTFDEAVAQFWDATFVPGAGFPDETIDRFADLKAPSFGVRVQHVLNNKSRKANFLRVNQAFEPQVVVFNNRHWRAGDFTEFEARSFHILEGAVDTVHFSPNPSRRPPRIDGPFVVGAAAAKNIDPLLAAIRKCDPNILLQVFGPSADLAQKASDLIAQGRLKQWGILREDELPNFYGSVDCVVHTEELGGWSNLVAEGMACGVPVICTPHGTRAFARHEETAIVISDPTPEALAGSIDQLRKDKPLATKIARNARARISSAPWTSYSASLLRIIRNPSHDYYFFAPEFDLYGKWPPYQWLDGLHPILKACASKTICDIGAGEGLASRWLLDAGASLAHGFEQDPARVALANSICADFPGSNFWQADLSNWPAFEKAHDDRLLAAYDIVLLGDCRHLPAGARSQAVEGAASRAKSWFALRTTEELFHEDCVEAVLNRRGFTLTHALANEEAPHLGACYVFKSP